MDPDIELAADDVTSPDTAISRDSLLPLRAGRVLVAASWLAVADNPLVSGPHSGPQQVVAWVSTILFLLAFPLAWARPGPAVLLLTGVGGVGMAFTISGNGPYIAVVSTIVMAGVRLPPAYSRPIAALAGIGFVAALALAGRLSPLQVVSPAIGLLFAYVAADALRRLRQEQHRTQALLQEVVEGRDARVRAAALDERARLARELHDVLAHTLSALSIQLEGARLLAEHHPGDPALAGAIERAGRLAREGLVEARRAVGSLRGDTLPGPDLFPALAEDFQRDSGIPVHLAVEGAVRELPPDGRLALYRVVQEALTNVRKHADATCIGITLRYAEDGTDLTVENDGSERPSRAIGGGFGLSGMRERAELLGGRLEAGPTDGGFRVHLWIPA